MASKSLGTLTLDIVAKVSGFVAGMDKADRATQKAVKRIKQNLSSIGKDLIKAGAVAGTIAAAGLAAVVKASAEAEKATAQLNARLKSTEGVAGKTSEGLQEMALALSKITTYDDEAIIGMETLLLQFTSIRGEIYDNTLPAVLDLSTALGRDLKSSALLVGKALNDPVKGLAALGKAGVKFTDEQKELLKTLVETGRLYEAQQIILDALTSKFGGAASAAANTFAGSLVQVKNAFGNLLENPAGLEANKAALQELAKTLSDPETVRAAATLTNTLIQGANKAAAAIGPLVYLMQNLKAALIGIDSKDIVRLQDDIAEAQDLLANPFPLVNRVKLFGPKGYIEYWSDDELKAEINKMQAAVDAALAGYNKPPVVAATNVLEPIVVTATKRSSDAVDDAFERGAKAKAQAAKELASAAAASAKAINDSISALQFEAETVGKTTDEITLLKLSLDGASPAQLKLADAALKTVDAYEKNTKAQEDYQSLLKDLRTDEEVLTDQLSERLAVLKEISNIPAEEREQVKSRIAGAAFADAPEYQGLAPEVGGALGESLKIQDAQKELEEWYATQLQMLEENRAKHAELNAQWNEQEVALAQEHADNLAKIDQARALVAYSALEETFSSLSGLARQFAGEQSDAYKVLFAAEKAAAIARSIVAIQTALAQASASAPFPANLAAMATVAAQTASIVATISSVAIQGQAHAGLMSVPKTGTYLLEKGERVTTANTSAKLDRTLDDVKGRTQSPQNIRIVNQFDSDEVVGGYLGSSAAESKVMNIVRKNQRTIRSLAL